MADRWQQTQGHGGPEARPPQPQPQLRVIPPGWRVALLRKPSCCASAPVGCLHRWVCCPSISILLSLPALLCAFRACLLDCACSGPFFSLDRARGKERPFAHGPQIACSACASLTPGARDLPFCGSAPPLVLTKAGRSQPWALPAPHLVFSASWSFTPVAARASQGGMQPCACGPAPCHAVAMAVGVGAERAVACTDGGAHSRLASWHDQQGARQVAPAIRRCIQRPC